MDDIIFANLTIKLCSYKIFPISNVLIAKFSTDNVTLLQPYRINKTSSNIGKLFLQNYIITVIKYINYFSAVYESYGLWQKHKGSSVQIDALSIAQRRHNLQKTDLTVVLYLQNPDSLNHLSDLT